jgi:nicotinamidase-related amidase
MELQADTALLLIDVVSPFDYPEAEALLAAVRPLAPRVRALSERFRALQLPIIYVNDNFGRWRSNFHELVEDCLTKPGADVVNLLRPQMGDYFILKPHRSAFYCTPLELLLQRLKVQHLVLTGWTSDMCILATASDARMREYTSTLVTDGTAAWSVARHERALALLRDSCDASLHTAAEVMSNPSIGR